MKSAEAEGARAGGAFRLDSTTPGAVPRAFDAFRSGWQTQVGDGFPLPAFSRATIDDFRVRTRATTVGDAAITDIEGASAIRTAGTAGGVEDQVRLYAVYRGAWTLGGARDGVEHTVSAGQFLLRHVGRPSHFETAPGTTARVIVLPAAMLTPLLGDRVVTGPADLAEVRLLVSHANMIHATMADLGAAGVRAARGALLELAKAVAGR
ncbi:DNA-binding protein, partial [Streptomyces broussonetiae]